MPRLAFTLIIRLADRAGPPAEWTSWSDAAACLGPATTRPHSTQPYKRYPFQVPDGRLYFADHITQVLFPPVESGGGGRWLLVPEDLRLWVGLKAAPEHALSIDLLELVRFGLAPHRAYGLVHLTAVVDPCPADALRIAEALHQRFRKHSDADRPYLAVGARAAHGAEVLRGRKPLEALARRLFGSAHEDAYLRAWVCAAAQPPAGLAADDIAAWRRGLGRGFGSMDRARAALDLSRERDERQSIQLGPSNGIVLERSAAWTFTGPPAPQVYNVRSYWCEVLLLAIVQHDSIEGYATELGRLGQDPLSRPVDELYERWLAFRNVLGWRHLSTTSDVPQRLLGLARDGLGTQPLLEELEQSFATYIAQRQRRSDDLQARSLAALQVYGAVFATVGTVAAALQVIGDGLFDGGVERTAVVAGLALLGLVVYLVMRRRVVV